MRRDLDQEWAQSRPRAGAAWAQCRRGLGPSADRSGRGTSAAWTYAGTGERRRTWVRGEDQEPYGGRGRGSLKWRTGELMMRTGGMRLEATRGSWSRYAGTSKSRSKFATPSMARWPGDDGGGMMLLSEKGEMELGEESRKMGESRS